MRQVVQVAQPGRQEIVRRRRSGRRDGIDEVHGDNRLADYSGWAIVERLLKDLAPLQDRLWLVIDDLHELGSDQARRQLELLVMRAPRNCGWCWPPGMTCGWGCTGFGWRVS
jgi:hypothetical protein